MSLWWEVRVKTPQGNEDATLVMGKTTEEARQNAVSEFWRTHRCGGSIVSIEIYADDENDQIVGGFDKEGLLPRPHDPPPGDNRLTT